MTEERKRECMSLNNFVNSIQSVTNQNELHQLKESIKDQVMNPNLRWDERMVLYKQVQLINEWMTKLEQMSKTC